MNSCWPRRAQKRGRHLLSVAPAQCVMVCGCRKRCLGYAVTFEEPQTLTCRSAAALLCVCSDTLQHTTHSQHTLLLQCAAQVCRCPDCCLLGEGRRTHEWLDEARSLCRRPKCERACCCLTLLAMFRVATAAGADRQAGAYCGSMFNTISHRSRLLGPPAVGWVVHGQNGQCIACYFSVSS